ncbi:MAG: hypothetical protein ACREIR_12150 [Geminicoccaceae bacterium]
MRSSCLLVAAVVLGGALPAWAQYDNRLGELTPEIQAFGHPALVESIQSNVENEFERRNDAIEDARDDYLQAEGPEPLHEEWVAYHQQQAEQRTRNFEGFYDAAEDIIEREGLGGEQGIHPALLWLARIRQEQFAFQIAVKGMPLARLRDLLEAKTHLYVQALSDLEGEQAALESNDNSIDSSAKSYRQTLLTACTDLRRIKTEADRDLSRASTEVVPELTPDQAGEFRARLRRRIDQLLGDIQLFQSRANTALGQIEGVHDQEMAIMKMVLAKRQAVQGVRDSFNLKIAETQFNDQLDLARDQIELVRPDGDKKDLAAYVDNAEEDLEPALERFEDAEEELADHFEGIFLPRYDSSTNERWVEFAEWEDWADEVQGCAPADLLVNLETSADGRWGARPGIVADADARAIVEDALEEAAERLVAAIDAALVEARRLDQASQLGERRSLQDQLNRSS